MSRVAALALALLAPAVLAGCASDGAPPAGAGTAAADDAGGPALSGSAHVAMIDMEFSPEVIRVKPGTTVTWANHEAIGHTVSADDANQWGTRGSGDSPDQWVQEGGEWSHTFTAPGTYKYHCLPHATKSADGYKGMVGTVIVVNA